MSNFTDKTQFDYLYDALAKKFPGIQKADGTSSLFQFMSTPKAAVWKNGQDDPNAYDLANSISVNLDGFFIQDSNFAQAYKDFVTSIKPETGQNNPDYKKDQEAITNLNTNLANLIKSSRDEFHLFKKKNTDYEGNYEEWIADPHGGQDYDNQMKQVRFKRDNLLEHQTKIEAAIKGPLDSAKADVTIPTTDEKGNTVYIWRDMVSLSDGRDCPLVSIDGDLATDIERWNDSKEDSYEFDVTIEENQAITYPWKTTYTTTVENSCLEAKVSSEINTSRILADQHYKLRVTAVGANSYSIKRGGWYHANLVDPKMKIVEGGPWTNDSFFGPKGKLNLVPEEIFVLYKVRMYLTISTQTYKQQFEAHGNLDITEFDLLGLRFGYGGLDSLQPQGDEKTTTIQLPCPSTNLAQIIGISSRVAWNGNK